MPYPFMNESERGQFCERFGLFVKDERKKVLHNKGYETLEQNKGIYIKIELPTAKRKGNISISFSLHKFYNAMKKKGLYNYDDFDFCRANEAGRMLSELLTIDLSVATVKKFEIGINIVTEGDPDEYMKELSMIKVKAREMRIIEDLHYKEFKQFSTHKDRDKRIIYIFYNKTFEARSKTKDTYKRETIPDNILRVEKDNHRPIEKVCFSQLFDPVYQQIIKQEFQQRFVSDLIYKGTPTKTKDITTKQLQIWSLLQEKGESEVKRYFESLRKRGAITQRQYYYSVQQIEEIGRKKIEPQIAISKRAKELRQLIINKICEM